MKELRQALIGNFLLLSVIVGGYIGAPRLLEYLNSKEFGYLMRERTSNPIMNELVLQKRLGYFCNKDYDIPEQYLLKHFTPGESKASVINKLEGRHYYDNGKMIEASMYYDQRLFMRFYLRFYFDFDGSQNLKEVRGFCHDKAV